MLVAASAAPPRVSAQNEPTAADVDRIIREFAAREQEFKLARANYTFRQDVRVQELDSRGNIQFDAKGNMIEYRAVTDILFDSKGRRIEKKIEGPTDRLFRLRLTREDFDDVRNIQPFVLTTDELPRYSIRYTGRDRVDGIPCYMFDVGPRRIEKGERYFQGTIWVDESALQIIKTYGKAVPDLRKGLLDENLFPRFETYRQQIDGQYWFPAYTIAEDTLQFSALGGGPLRVRHIIRYENYKQFTSEVKIIPQDRQGSGK